MNNDGCSTDFVRIAVRLAILLYIIYTNLVDLFPLLHRESTSSQYYLYIQDENPSMIP